MLIRIGKWDQPSLYIDNRAWLEHLKKFGVDVKINVYRLPTTGILHEKLNLCLGQNLFTGECIDNSGLRFRLLNKHQQSGEIRFPFTKGDDVRTLERNDTTHWFPADVYQYYTETIHIKQCPYCSKVYKNQHNKCKPIANQ